MIPALQANHAHLNPVCAVPAISHTGSPQRHLQRDLHPRAPIVREEDAARPPFADGREELLGERKRGLVRRRGEEDVPVPPGRGGGRKRELGVGVCVGLPAGEGASVAARAMPLRVRT